MLESASRGVCSGGVSAPGGYLLPGVVGVSAWGGGVCSWGRVSTPGGCLLQGCLLWGCLLLSAPRGGGVYLLQGDVSQHALRQTPPPVNRITDACKTLPWPNFVAVGNKSVRKSEQSYVEPLIIFYFSF